MSGWRWRSSVWSHKTGGTDLKNVTKTKDVQWAIGLWLLDPRERDFWGSSGVFSIRRAGRLRQELQHDLQTGGYSQWEWQKQWGGESSEADVFWFPTLSDGPQSKSHNLLPRFKHWEPVCVQNAVLEQLTAPRRPFWLLFQVFLRKDFITRIASQPDKMPSFRCVAEIKIKAGFKDVFLSEEEGLI